MYFKIALHQNEFTLILFSKSFLKYSSTYNNTLSKPHSTPQESLRGKARRFAKGVVTHRAREAQTTAVPALDLPSGCSSLASLYQGQSIPFCKNNFSLIFSAEESPEQALWVRFSLSWIFRGVEELQSYAKWQICLSSFLPPFFFFPCVQFMQNICF